MSNTTDQLGKQATGVAEELERLGDSVGEAAQAEIRQVSDKAAECGAQAPDKVHGMACACEQYVRARPLRSVLVAAGIGWLLGHYWKRG